MGIREDDMDYTCRGPVQGFKVTLHTPNELPQVDGQYFRVPVGQDVRVSIKPNVLTTMQSLKGYQPIRFYISNRTSFCNNFTLPDDNVFSILSVNFDI